MPLTAERRPTWTSSDAPFGFKSSIAVFDRATRLAKSMFPSAGACIVLVHNGETWRSRHADIAPGPDLLTDQVLKSGELMWIEDLRLDTRFSDYSLVVGAPFLRFAVAFPIRLRDSSAQGVLSVAGLEPQPFDSGKAARLRDIADFVTDEWVKTHALAALEESLLERNRVLERMERSEERLNLALALADIHVWELDYSERKLFKAGAEDTFFCEPHTYESLYKDIYTTIDPRDRAAVETAWKDHVENGIPYRPEYRVYRPDGREVWALGAAKKFTDDEGRTLRLVGAMQNITTRKHAERALLAAKKEADAANKAKSDFLATMSHELRTPLNAILGFAEIIKDQLMGPLPERYVGYARDIHASGEHLLDLINDVLDVAKLEAGKVELHESEFVLRSQLAEIIASFSKQAEAAQVSILSQFSDAPVLLRADKRLMKQVVLNIISNALKFTPRGGTVTVATRRIPEAGFELSIADSGIGMSKPQIDIALTPFGQVDSKISRKHKGTGLGLPISLSLVRLHGGELLVESEPEIGTRVTIRLPEFRIVDRGDCLIAS